jgi:hypothetical protein
MIVSAAILLLVIASLAPVAVAENAKLVARPGSADAFLEALALVPDTPESRGSMLSYLDQRAAVAARPGAAQPGSIEEALALVEAGDPAARLWLAALMGVSSGDVGLLSRMTQAADWPEELGFDLLDVDRHLVFGAPPADGSILLGDFSPAAVADAWAEHGYSSSRAGTRKLLCGAAGCDRGMDMDIASADPGLPFGAEFGRSEPVAVSKHDLLNSADLATLEAMLAAADGEAPSMADDPMYRALALAADPATVLTQATLLPGGMMGLGPDIYATFSESPQAAGALLTELDDLFEPMPGAAAVAILDAATDTEQVVTIALAYADEADAHVAADVLPRRLATLPALSHEVSLTELLAARGVTSVTGTVVPAGEGRAALARVELSAPLASSEPDPSTDRLAPSSDLYRLFTSLVARRDLLWLVPVLPLE